MADSSNPSSGLIGVAYLPHGAMLLDPNRADLPEGAKALHLTCMKISEHIAELNPDIILLLTPHGLNLHHALNVYQPGVENCRASGDAEWNHQWTDYAIDVRLDGDATRDLYLHLKQNLPRVEAMLSFGGLSTPLRWGEVIPLYFALYHTILKDHSITSVMKHITVQSRPKVIIVAQPWRGATTEERHAFNIERQPYLIEFGRLIRTWCNKSSKRILLLISGDQAHTHAWSSQMPTIYQPDPSCFSVFPQIGTEHSNLFDNMIQDWIQGRRSSNDDGLYRLDEHLIANEAGSIEKFALSCGYSGSLVMQGVMENDLIQNRTDDSSKSINTSSYWLLTNFLYMRPTYYGMMAALYVRNGR